METTSTTTTSTTETIIRKTKRINNNIDNNNSSKTTSTAAETTATSATWPEATMPVSTGPRHLRLLLPSTSPSSVVSWIPGLIFPSTWTLGKAQVISKSPFCLLTYLGIRSTGKSVKLNQQTILSMPSPGVFSTSASAKTLEPLDSSMANLKALIAALEAACYPTGQRLNRHA